MFDRFVSFNKTGWICEEPIKHKILGAYMIYFRHKYESLGTKVSN